MKSMMEYNGYHAQINFDAEDMIFVGSVFGITDSLNFYGSSVEELEEMFHQSIDNYLEACKTYGKEPDKEFSGCFNIRISPELHKTIALRATEQQTNINNYVKNLLQNAIDAESIPKTNTYYTIDKHIDNITFNFGQQHTDEILGQYDISPIKMERSLNICR